MWTPLLLICYAETLDCAVPVTPAYVTQTECEAALGYVLSVIALPEGMIVVDSVCYNWGRGA